MAKTQADRGDRPRTVLLRHKGSAFDRDVIGRWLASATDLEAEIVIEPDRSRKLDTVRYEYRRNGLSGVLDGLAFRVYYQIRLAKKEQHKIDDLLEWGRDQYPNFQTDRYSVADPNDARTESLLEEINPDMMIARSRILLDERIFTRPRVGTFVVHPGICPEYRNQHGCFWALANGDDDLVGYSLIRIDEGIDTGEIHSQNGTSFDPIDDEHVYLQQKVVKDNLEEIGQTLRDVHGSQSTPLDTTDRRSAIWGMPKLSAWLTWKRRVKNFGIGYVDSSRE